MVKPPYCNTLEAKDAALYLNIGETLQYLQKAKRIRIRWSLKDKHNNKTTLEDKACSKTNAVC